MTTPNDIQKYVGWNKKNHASVRDGGVWGVPRSGLVFKKTADGWELMTVAPYLPEISGGFKAGKDVPASPSELRDYQRLDFLTLQRYHEAAGLKVSDPRGLLEPFPSILQSAEDERRQGRQ